jgi:hypothetical protein
MPNVISKSKQNSSDMNEIILDTLRCRLCTKLYWLFDRLIDIGFLTVGLFHSAFHLESYVLLVHNCGKCHIW